MKLLTALNILDYHFDYLNDKQLLKKQFKWFVKYYHPDNIQTGNAEKLKQVLEAYNELLRY